MNGQAEADLRAVPPPREAVPHTHAHDRLRRTLETVQDAAIILLMVILSQIVLVLPLTELFRTLSSTCASTARRSPWSPRSASSRPSRTSSSGPRTSST
jgi:hypothetical protein